MKRKNQFRTWLTAIALTANLLPSTAAMPVFAKYGTGNNVVEHLDRGISAIQTGNGMLVSWRYLANDADNAEFRLYRDEKLVYSSGAGDATCYLDEDGSAASVYSLETLSGGQVIQKETCHLISGQSYFSIPLDIPAGGADYGYTANDCSVGDVDGDGVYEIFLKWDPTNAKDNSQSGYTGNVYIDCYRLSGEKLWRIDLGKNIRAGAHYTQFLVADFDCDGKAEMTCKTADGTVDGTGKVIGDASKDYRNGGGYILDGPEFYTLFDGATGAALDTVDYAYPRGEVTKQTWGDNYGNRCDRFLGAVCYLDGVHPSAVSVRGYYTRMTAVAYDVVNKKLVKRWGFDTGYDPSAPGYADGNHNCMPADVDNDGKQELVLGATCLDDDGSVLWCNEKGHGDAMHLSDFLPDRPGLELWVCHEHTPFGVSLIDPSNGKDIFHKDGDKDTGRCCAANIYAGNPGAEFWGARPAGVVMDGNGNSTGIAVPSMNFLIYWDGDLEREIQSGIAITKVDQNKKIITLLNADGCASNNSTKATPNLTADIFGDWREELVLRTEDSKYLRIYCTTNPTDHRITTLMHDVQYRTQVAGEQTCYNQPPHTSFYLGSDQPLPERPAVTVLGAEETPVTPSETPAPTEPTVPGYYMGESTDFIVGDITHDNMLNVFDLSLLKKEVITPFLNRHDRRRADTNADGYVDLVDVIILQKYLLNVGRITAVTEGKSFWYATDAAYTEGVEETVNAGFHENAYVNLDNKVGSTIEWTIYVPAEGIQNVIFGYANGTADNRSMQITVNGAETGSSIDFPSTGAWTDWAEQSIALELHPGENVIRMSSETEGGAPNLDYLRTELIPASQ